MRKILFRAWDRENQCYHKPIYNAIEGQLEELLINQNGRLAMWCMKGLQDESIFPDRFELEQFTGLTDRNGKEIYEGDVVSDRKFIYKVEWNEQNAKFCINPIDKVDKSEVDFFYEINYGQLGDGYYSRRDLEIIGNIHDKTNDNA